MYGCVQVSETLRNGIVVTEGDASPRAIEYYNFGFQDGIHRDWEIKPGK